MLSIIYIKKDKNIYNIQKDYFLKRNTYFHTQLSQLGVEFAGYLMNFGNQFQFTGNSFLDKKEEIVLITSQTITNNELSLIRKFLQVSKITVLGCVLKEVNFSNKTVLHPSLDEARNIPSWHEEGSKLFTGMTLPGYSCFSTESVTKSYYKLVQDFPKESFRLKFGNGYNSIDHYIIKSEKDFHKVIEIVKKFDALESVGVSIEPNLNKVRSYGVTRLKFGNKKQVSIGTQSFSQETYIGTELIANPTKNHTKFIDLNSAAYKKLSPHSLQLNRFNTDIVEGELTDGTTLYGITDLSLRTGAATIIELEILTQNPGEGIYQIYSNKRLFSEKLDQLHKYLTDTDIKIVLHSRYVITLLYSASSKHYLQTPRFKEIEENIKGVAYNKNLLFRI